MQAAAVTMYGVHDPVERVLPRVLACIREAAREGAKAVFLPELILGHYHEVPIAADGPEVEAVSKCAEETGTAVGVGIGEKDGDHLYSAYVLCGPEGSVSVHRKTRWQTPRCPISLGGVAATYDLLHVKVGIMICAETRFPEVAQSLAARGAQLLVMPHAYGVGGPKWQPLQAAIENVVAARCRETSLPAIVVAATGDGFQGGCALVDAQGEVLYHQTDDHEQVHRFRMETIDGKIRSGMIAESEED